MSQKKLCYLVIRVTEKEKERAQAMACVMGMSVSEMIRKWIEIKKAVQK